jgi:predicted Fe-S protein YdhL (DUF1289 family)
MQEDADHRAPDAPPSPCINVCALDARGFCIGCGRTGDEIARWMTLSAAQQWELIRELERRKRSTAPPVSSGTEPPGELD